MAVAGSGLALGAVPAGAQDKDAGKTMGKTMDKPMEKLSLAKFKPVEYKAQTWMFDNFAGLSKDMLEQHYKLYTGYVTNTNKANAELAAMLAEDKADTYDYAEIRRRLGFEYNGMRLHEYYFGAMKPGGSGVDEKLKSAVMAVWGSWEAWMADFIRTGLMRGIGWAILYQDPMNPMALSHHWIGDHELFHPAGFTPILVMDVWEHAYIKDYGASGRKGYVDAWLKNIDWGVVGKRLSK